MNEKELEFYEAGIRDTNESRHIVVACRSARYAALRKKYHLVIGKESANCLNAYNKGVAYEINRQTKLGA